MNVRLAVDLSHETLAVYRDNFGPESSAIRLDDVARIFPGNKGSRLGQVERYWKGRVGTVDLVVSGPPCQGHSDLNNSTRRNDPRNSLYLRVARAVEVLRPKAVIIENVPAVLLDRTGVVDRAVKWLEALGYHVSQDVLLLTRFSVPQIRKRHILIATVEKPFDLVGFSNGTNGPLCVGDYLAGLEDAVSLNGDLLHRPAQMTDVNRRRVDYLFRLDKYDLPDKMRPSCHKDKKHAYKSMYGRIHWDKPAQTLTSGFGSMGQGRYIHPTRRRLLTPHEAARIQGFPDFFKFTTASTVTSLREMIANAVPPQCAATLVAGLIDGGQL